MDPDLSLPSRGMPVELRFYYYSQDDYNAEFGYGRTLSYNRFLQENVPSAGKVTVHVGTGERRIYTWDGSKYVPPAGVFDTLTKAGDGTWAEVRAADQVYFAYDAAGRLKSVNDLNGNTHTVFRDANNRINKLTDAASRPVYFNYDANGRLSYMIDWGNRRQTFTYSLVSQYLTDNSLLLTGVMAQAARLGVGDAWERSL